MTILPLDELLTRVGELDDAPGDDCGRERFRRYLKHHIFDLQLLALYIDECVAAPGEQYARALQDLVNHLGGFLGFEVGHGPYVELSGRIGFDGRWRSPTGFEVVVELKSDENFAARRAGLARSIESLIARKEISGWSEVSGLYVVAADEVPTRFLKKLILDEPQAHQIRISTVSALHTLAELAANQTLNHGQIVELLRSGAPEIDPLVGIVSRVDRRATRQFMADIFAERIG